MIELFVKLLMGHALSDFALQSDVMAKGKNRNRKPDYIPEGQKAQPAWIYWLTAHGLIHGMAVWLITGSIWIGVAETVCHAAIDFGKCDNHYGIHLDQAMHVGCKILWCFFKRKQREGRRDDLSNSWMLFNRGA